MLPAGPDFVDFGWDTTSLERDDPPSVSAPCLGRRRGQAVRGDFAYKTQILAPWTHTTKDLGIPQVSAKGVSGETSFQINPDLAPLERRPGKGKVPSGSWPFSRFCWLWPNVFRLAVSMSE